MSSHRLAAIGALALAALCLPAGSASAGGCYHCPRSAPAIGQSADNTRHTLYYLPAGAPVNRNYAWYAPPAGYQVLLEGTPVAPRAVTVVGPDGNARTTQLEGSVVVRLRYYALRTGSR